MTGIHALVVSADPLLRTSLATSLLSDEGPVSRVTTVATCEPAMGLTADVDVVVLDAEGLDVSPPDMCSSIAQRSDVPVLVLSDEAELGRLAECLEAGAAGFQTKGLTLLELRAAVAAVHRGEAVVPRRMLGGLLKNLIQRRRQDDAAVARYDRLTRREREILAMIADGDDRDVIASSLFISPQTARTHIQNVLTKLEVHSRHEAANFAIEHGYTDVMQASAR